MRYRTSAFGSSAGVLLASLLGLGPVGFSVPSDPAQKPPDAAPWQRLLTGDDAKRVEDLERKFAELYEAGRYAEAQVPARASVALRTRLQGATHWQTVSMKRHLETLEQITTLPADAQAELTEATKLEKELAKLKGEGRYRDGIGVARRIVAIRQRHLGEEHRLVAPALNDQGICAHNAGQYTEAETLFRRALALCQKLLGDEHPHTAAAITNLALSLSAQDKYTEARPLHHRALEIHLRAQGKDHEDTAVAYNNLATYFEKQGLYGEAERLHHQAVEILLRVHGEKHLKTAVAYNNLGFNLNHQGKYADAQQWYHKALEIQRALSGADHPETVLLYNNLAVNLADQGRYADAEPLYRKALAVRSGTLGEEHPWTASTYGNLALTLSHQGKLAEAEQLFRRALKIQDRPPGEEQRSTAACCSNLASNLQAQGRHAEAEALLEKALAIHQRLLGEDHADTALSYNNLAASFDAQRKYAAAEPLLRKALDIFRRRLGEEHPQTAQAYSNLAVNLYNQEKYAEAEPLHVQALEKHRQLLGEGHPTTAWAYKNLVSNWWAQGQYEQAEKVGPAATKSFEAARRRISFAGLERASYAADNSPLRFLAAVAARTGKPVAAWQSLENDLARGLLDDLSVRLLNAEERRHEQDLLGKLNRLDSQIAALLGTHKVTQAAREQVDQLRRQRDAVQAECAQVQADLAAKYGVAAGAVYELDRLQKQLRPDAALLTWLDLQGEPKSADPNGEHWACVVRHRGPPLWTRLPGSGPSATWLPADEHLASQARQAFSRLSQDAEGPWTDLARKLYAQRLAPVERHLGANAGLPAVRHLIVLPSFQMRRIPLEVLTDRYTVSYAPSGTMFAWLYEKRSEAERAGRDRRPARLLAVGDPVFESAQPPVSLPPPPEHGVLIVAVLPGSNAAGSGIQAGDVFLRYSRTKLNTPADLDAAIAAGAAAQPSGAPRGAVSIPVRVWREGKTLDLAVRPGRLGVEISPEPVAQALRAHREREALMRGPRREAFSPLPGTRTEVQAIARTFPKADLLLGSEASEQNLDRLATTGRLREFRFLHLATHGVLDNESALRSALILAQDQLPDPLEQVLAGKEAYDGRLTVEQMLRSWRLDADLVTLSACQTGLGEYSGGVGYVGFSQALFLAGARSLVLSLWRVDDTATALLMTRFYENLLGTRAGLAKPMPKAQALAEAKSWLRGLNAEEVQRLVAGLPDAARGAVRTRKPAQTPTPAKPFTHPYYWSGFILIGDPR